MSGAKKAGVQVSNTPSYNGKIIVMRQVLPMPRSRYSYAPVGFQN